jgi:hypothetical protein
MNNNINGHWNAKNIVNDHSLNNMISLNYIGNLGYYIF